MLFSATSTQKIEDLARLALKKEPIAVGVEDVTEDIATVEGLEQGKMCFIFNKVSLFKCFFYQATSSARLKSGCFFSFLS